MKKLGMAQITAVIMASNSIPFLNFGFKAINKRGEVNKIPIPKGEGFKPSGDQKLEALQKSV